MQNFDIMWFDEPIGAAHPGVIMDISFEGLDGVWWVVKIPNCDIGLTFSTG